jgi:hypothetical protein
MLMLLRGMRIFCWRSKSPLTEKRKLTNGRRKLLALHAGISNQKLNGLMALYTAARVGFATSYILIESERGSFLRTFFWWMGNVCCISMLVMASKRL